MSSGRVVALHRKVDGGVEPAEELSAVASRGFIGDKCYGRPTRQVLFVAVDHLEALGYRPGDLREQVTVDLPGLQTLSEGAVLSIGDTRFEIVGDCAPCSKMAGYMGEEPQSFIAKTTRKRGMLAKVLNDGTIRVGDTVTTQDV
ncbi:MAG: hypothetical protein HONBIEJF_01653 [Fimbriimonadaceae bacterium]|nr:hypothetical protein [Fimbriimonadaceae bacterium]